MCAGEAVDGSPKSLICKHLRQRSGGSIAELHGGINREMANAAPFGLLFAPVRGLGGEAPPFRADEGPSQGGRPGCGFVC